MFHTQCKVQTCIQQNHKNMNVPLPAGSESKPLLSSLRSETRGNVNISTESMESSPEDPSPFQQFLYAINPIDIENWPEMNLIKKIYEVFKVYIDHKFLNEISVLELYS